MANTEVPLWYGKHDNPHHSGMRSHLKRIASCEEELEEYTGLKGKHISPRGQSQREIIKVAIDSQVIYKA
jgi:hypothetical protein